MEKPLTQRPFRDLKVEATLKDSHDAMRMFNKIRRDCYKCIAVAHDVVRDVNMMEKHYQDSFKIADEKGENGRGNSGA
jgi:hypothetical protein